MPCVAHLPRRVRGDIGQSALQNQTRKDLRARHFRHAKLKFAVHGWSDNPSAIRRAVYTPSGFRNSSRRNEHGMTAGRHVQSHQNQSDEERMQFKHCRLEFDGPVATLMFDHQEVMNAFSPDMYGGLTEALDAIEDKRDDVRCVVLTGAGKAFCTGANLQGRNDDKSPGRKTAGSTLETVFHPFLRRLRNLHCPLVTSVNGPAAGAGMSFALMGDIIVCARSSYFLQAFRRIGLVPDCGSTWILPRLIGKARAVELSLLGERLPAEKALEWGLVNRVVDDAALAEETKKLAHDLANGPTVALSLIRQLYWESEHNSFEDQLDLEMRSQLKAGKSEDFKEGVGAFLAKRPAQFKGR
jgi:2-(1,2-epoxy-1,2-dihydrophenyl)acetyl-CoA isomerase